MNRLSSLLILATAASCSTGAKTTEGKPAERAVQTPLTVRWSLDREEAGHLAVTAVVELHARLHQKVVVRVEVPAGLTRVSGEPSFEVPAEAAAAEVKVAYEFAYSGAAPVGDLRLVADVNGPGTGVHATDSYRFGRSATLPPRPTAEGPGVHYGDKDLGPAVPLDKP